MSVLNKLDISKRINKYNYHRTVINDINTDCKPPVSSKLLWQTVCVCVCVCVCVE